MFTTKNRCEKINGAAAAQIKAPAPAQSQSQTPASIRYRVLLDISGSMLEKTLTGRTRLEALSEKLAQAVEKIDDKSVVEVYTFAERLEFFATGDKLPADSGELARILLPERDMCTKLWECIYNAVEDTAEMISNEKDKAKAAGKSDASYAPGAGSEYSIICITDGDDSGSRYSECDVRALLERHGDIRLKLIRIADESETVEANDGSNDGPETCHEEKAIEVVKTGDAEDIILDFTPTAAIKAKPFFVPEPPPVTCTIIPLAGASANDIELVRRGVNRAAFYAEYLSGLRYYPVPTVITDKNTIIELKKIKLEPHPADIRREAAELNHLITHISLMFHSKFCYGDMLSFWPFKEQEQTRKIWTFAESIWFVIRRVIDGEDPRKLIGSIVEKVYPLVSQNRDFISCAYDGLKFMAKIMKEFCKAEPDYKCNTLNYRVERDDIVITFNTPDHMIYRPITPETLKGVEDRHYEKIVRNYDNARRCWKYGILNVIEVFDSAVEALFKLLPVLERYRGKNYYASCRLQTLGMYMPPGCSASDDLVQKFKAAGYGENFIASLGAGGMVLIAAEECRQSALESQSYELSEEKTKLEKEIKRLSEAISNRYAPYGMTLYEARNKKEELEARLAEIAKTASDMAAGPSSALSALQDSIIEATVVHEHIHAITAEGIQGRKFPSCAPGGGHDGSEEYTLVSETLAEWAELNYFRHDDEMYRIILAHAQSGKMPSWPYAGAVVLETLPEHRREAEFKKIMTLLRRDTAKAAKRLKKNIIKVSS